MKFGIHALLALVLMIIMGLSIYHENGFSALVAVFWLVLIGIDFFTEGALRRQLLKKRT